MPKDKGYMPKRQSRGGPPAGFPASRPAPSAPKVDHFGFTRNPKHGPGGPMKSDPFPPNPGQNLGHGSHAATKPMTAPRPVLIERYAKVHKTAPKPTKQRLGTTTTRGPRGVVTTTVRGPRGVPVVSRTRRRGRGTLG